jgi:hypothetical protein
MSITTLITLAIVLHGGMYSNAFDTGRDYETVAASWSDAARMLSVSSETTNLPPNIYICHIIMFLL